MCDQLVSGWIVGGLVDQWVFPWPVFPTVFWGLFVLSWWRDVYGKNSISEQHIQREIEQLRHDLDAGRHLRTMTVGTYGPGVHRQSHGDSPYV